MQFFVKSLFIYLLKIDLSIIVSENRVNKLEKTMSKRMS